MVQCCLCIIVVIYEVTCFKKIIPSLCKVMHILYMDYTYIIYYTSYFAAQYFRKTNRGSCRILNLWVQNPILLCKKYIERLNWTCVRFVHPPFGLFLLRNSFLFSKLFSYHNVKMLKRGKKECESYLCDKERFTYLLYASLEIYQSKSFTRIRLAYPFFLEINPLSLFKICFIVLLHLSKKKKKALLLSLTIET